ncbi:uncharacterized protein LOC122927133 isoform X2 [Bufo gargarizans]|nr:uncharacterized protein LOC122927133 isoform X2 [Bufo gargarizans]
MEKETKPKIPSSHFSAEKEERKVTVLVENPHTPVRHVIAFLRQFCTVVRNPTKNLDGNGFWNSSWSVTVQLKKDPSTSDGLQHLPQRCTLGNAEALITYSDIPQICNGNPGQKFNDSPRKTTCNLQDQEHHVDKECPKKSHMQLKIKQDNMAVLSSIPVEMRDELLAGVEYIKTLANRFQNLDPVMVDLFGEKLAERLCQKYTGHWYPEKPMKGQAYRCIRINRHDRDESILEACSHSGLKYHELTLPKEMTLWIDPYEVSCRLREESNPYTVARFDLRTPHLPDPSSRVLNSSYADCSTPTPEEDSSIGSSSLPSSPSLNGEDSDSGIDVNCDRTTTPPMSCSPTEEHIWRNPAVNQDSIFRMSPPLWIPAWSAPQFCHPDPQQFHWL